VDDLSAVVTPRTVFGDGVTRFRIETLERRRRQNENPLNFKEGGALKFLT